MADLYVCSHGATNPCDECKATRIGLILAMRKGLDPDAPEAIVLPDPAPNKLAREAAYEIVGLMNPDVDRVEQIILKHFGTEL